MGNTNTLVSVVIPTFNRSQLLMETIASVLGQTYPHLEVIIVDDGSTDDTQERVATIPDPRIVYVKTENSGLPAAARNTGIQQAKGAFIAFLDSDDLWLPEKIETQLSQLEVTGTKWCYCDHYIFDHTTGENAYLRSDVAPLVDGLAAKDIFLLNRIGSPTPIVSKEIFDEIGLFDTDHGIRFVEDWDMWLRIAAKNPVSCVRKPLARYRVHTSNSTNTESILDTAKKSFAVAAKVSRLHPDIYGPLHAQSVVAHCRAQSKKMLAQGEPALAREMINIARAEAGTSKGLRMLALATIIPPRILQAVI